MLDRFLPKYDASYKGDTSYIFFVSGITAELVLVTID